MIGIAALVLGAGLLAASVPPALGDDVPGWERRLFRAINGLPGWLYVPLWLPMQLGNLVVGTAVGLGAAALLGDGPLAVGVLAAVAMKLVAERIVRARMEAHLAVRQRPGTSQPGAVRRGADVPAVGPSFPSGHVILATAVAVVVLDPLPGPWRWLVLVLPALVALGRVYVGAHNPLDVVAGAGVGLIVGGLVDLVLR